MIKDKRRTVVFDSKPAKDKTPPPASSPAPMGWEGFPDPADLDYEPQRPLMEVLTGMATHPGPPTEFTPLYENVCPAITSACAIAKMGRHTDLLTPSQFLIHQTLLRRHMEEARKIIRSGVMKKVPTTPGLTFSHKAGNSAVEVAYEFAKGILSATLHTRPPEMESVSFNAQDEGPNTVPADVRNQLAANADPTLARWMAAIQKEMREVFQPWPTQSPGEIKKEENRLSKLLADEHASAARTQVAAPWSLRMSKKTMAKRLGVSRQVLAEMESRGEIEIETVNRESFKIRLTEAVKIAFAASE